MDLQQNGLGTLKIVLPHQIVSALNFDINAACICLFSLLHGLQAFPFGLPFLKQVSQAHLSNTSICLCDIPFYFLLRRCGFEGISYALLSNSDSAFIGLYGLDALIDISQLHKSLIRSCGDILDIAFKNFLCFFFSLCDFEEIGIAHDEHFICGILLVGQIVEVFSLLIIKLLVFFLRHLEESLEWQFLEGLDRHQQPIYYNIQYHIIKAYYSSTTPKIGHDMQGQRYQSSKDFYILCCYIIRNMIKKIFLMLLLFICPFASTEDEQISPDAIFGVRWFLGQNFRLQQPIPHVDDGTTNCDLMLIFNTHQPYLNLSFKVRIANTLYVCSTTRVLVNVTSDHHQNFNELASKVGDTFNTYIRKCPVAFSDHQYLQKTAILPYSILAYQGQVDLELFKAKLRSPAYEQKEYQVAVLGDWGLITNFSHQYKHIEPITDCLLDKIQEKKDLRLLLILGDLGYDLQGKTYVHFLSYLQTFSSQIAILLTPGNHESIRHQDIFILFQQSFYSPFWSRFYGYFDLVLIRNHIFLGYNPQHLFKWLDRTSHSSLFQISLKEQFQNFTNLFNLQFPLETRNMIKKNTLIAFSHYPTYCSQQSELEDCSKYRRLHYELTAQLQEIGADLFFSGHVHIYERTKQICNNESIIKNGQKNEGVYQFWLEKGCSLFVIEGVAGNNYFVETAHNLQLKNFSQKIVGNTGFGVLTLNSGGSDDLHFAHMSTAEGCWPADEFILHGHSNIIEHSSLGGILLAILIVIAIIALLLAIRTGLKWMMHRFRHKAKYSIKLQDNVIQLAQNTERY